MKRSGQSLVEVLIGVAIGAIFIIGAATIIAPTGRLNSRTGNIQSQALIGSELLNNLRAWAQNDWHNVLNRATSSANKYYLNTSSSPITAATGTETIAVATGTFIRYFYIDDVYRDGSGNATTTIGANTYDPSTKQATVIVAQTSTPTSTFILYLARSVSNGYGQTDWSGGTTTSVATVVGNTYTTSTNIATNVEGAITLSGSGGGGSCIQ